MKCLKLSALILGCLSSSAFSQAQPKLDVCHVKHQDGLSFELISIPSAALSAHRAHGDIMAPPAGSTAGARADGKVYVLDSNCDVVYIADE